MSFQGAVASMALGDVVQNLDGNRKTGTLTIESPRLDCHIQFEGGAIVSCVGTDDVDFGQWLLDKGLVTSTELADAQKRHRRSKKRSFGEVLERCGYMALDQYRAYFLEVVNDRLCEALNLDDGSFVFHEGELAPEFGDAEARALGISFSAQNALMEAARRSDDWANIRRHLPSDNEIYTFGSCDKDALLERGDVAAATIGLMDGANTIGQVIARLPYSRFEARRCLAELVAEKIIRPLDSAQIVAQTDGLDPADAITRLTSVLEREPNNIDVLTRLAGLCEAHSATDEAAKFNKILANSYLDQGDLESAKNHLIKSVDLNPGDVMSWQKCWSCIRELRDIDEIRAFGERYVRNFRDAGLMEIVRDTLRDLIELFPGEKTFEIEHAEAHFALGDEKAGVQGLSVVGNEFLKARQYDEAEQVLSRLLKFDPKNERVRKVLAQIKTGKLKRRRALRKRIFRQAVLASGVVLAGFVAIREISVQNELFSALRSLLSESRIGDESAARARDRIEEIRSRYPYSLSASQQGESLIRALESSPATAPSTDDSANEHR